MNTPLLPESRERRPVVPAPSAFPVTAPDLAAVKRRQQVAWASGDYAVVGTTLQIVGETLCEAAGVRAAERVLDVAAGNGNASLAAARRFAEVTSTDYVPHSWSAAEPAPPRTGSRSPPRGRRRGAPLRGRRLRIVLSTFGAMFAPDQERRGGDAARLAAPAGGSGWRADPGGVRRRAVQDRRPPRPPPAGVRPPALWGTEGPAGRAVRPRGGVDCLVAAGVQLPLPVGRHWVRCSAPSTAPCTRPSWPSTLPSGTGWERDLLDLLARFDRGGGAGLVVPGEYLEVVVTRR
jgi:hypothetical protein